MTRVCDHNETALLFYSFWPLVGFGLYVCADTVQNSGRYAETLSGATTSTVLVHTLVNGIHMSVLNASVLSGIHLYNVMSSVRPWVCTRPRVIEMHAILAFGLVYVLLICDSLHYAFHSSHTHPPTLIAICQTAVWLVGVATLVYCVRLSMRT